MFILDYVQAFLIKFHLSQHQQHRQVPIWLHNRHNLLHPNLRQGKLLRKNHHHYIEHSTE